MDVDVTCDQTQVLIARQNWLILLDDFRGVVILVEKQQVIGQVNRSLGIARKFLQHFVPQRRRLLVVPRPGEISFPFPHHLWILVDCWIGIRPIQPALRDRQFVSFERRVCAA